MTPTVSAIDSIVRSACPRTQVASDSNVHEDMSQDLKSGHDGSDSMETTANELLDRILPSAPARLPLGYSFAKTKSGQIEQCSLF